MAASGIMSATRVMAEVIFTSLNSHAHQELVNERIKAVLLKKMAYFIDSHCTKCGACLPECPTGSIIEGKNQYYIDADTCANHAACVAVCPVDVISKIKVDPLLHKKRDEEEEET